MTGDDFTEALRTVGWSRAQVAVMLDCDSKSVWRWSSGDARVPTAVALWINKVIKALNRVPPPTEWRAR